MTTTPLEHPRQKAPGLMTLTAMSRQAGGAYKAVGVFSRPSGARTGQTPGHRHIQVRGRP